MNFSEIKQFPFSAYRCDVPIAGIESQIERWNENGQTLLLQPSFQRGFVWTDEQRTNYIEYLLKGGLSGREIYFNCPNWLTNVKEYVIELVDGQQRINAIRMFLRDEIKVFGCFKSEIIDFPEWRYSLSFNVMKIKNRKELIEWYIGMNKGGSIHTEKDLAPAYDELKNL